MLAPNPSSSTHRRRVYSVSFFVPLFALILIKLESWEIQRALRINFPLLQGSEGIERNAMINIAKGKMATQSSTFKNYKATLATDGDLHTFSHTNDDKAWLLIDLGKTYHIKSVNFVNRWCKNPSDSGGCLCRLSNAMISLLDRNGSAFVTRSIGDTCHLKDVAVEFDSDCSTSTLTRKKNSSITNACLPSAQKVKIESTTRQQIQVFEVQVFSPRNMVWESSKTATKFHFYSMLRGDRSGSAILDMIYCHAHSYHKNATYGGAVGNNNPMISAHEKLLQRLGLNFSIIPAVPSNDSSHVVLGPGVYRQSGLDGKLFTTDYLLYLRSQTNYIETDIDIAVHVRRGDVTPCHSKEGVAYRYLPNSYYLDLIKQHAKSKSRVVIYSVFQHFEPLDIFHKMGYEVRLNDELGDVWEAIVNAKVVIMSKSAFSYVPAMLCKGKVLYPGPFNPTAIDTGLPGWERVNVSVYDQEKVVMQEKLCRGNARPNNTLDPENKVD